MRFQNLAYAILKNPIIYWTYQKIVGGDNARKRFIEAVVKPHKTMKLLDIGCGPGNILDFMPPLDYYGFDNNPAYIEAAKNTYKNRGTFICSDIWDFNDLGTGNFDTVLAVGVIHHLDDATAQQLFKTAYAALKTGGKLITFDGCYTKKQNPIAYWMLRLDRGKFVRRQEAYEALANTSFKHIKSTLNTTYFSIPYTSLIMECTKD